ncbi:MAG: lipoyl(octanoyl) transferase LipB [Alphaproteobacteria bacterium]|nr:lipoyl(octanoyl) transferase LipB [Alphaproteobacteria bacterium]
MTKTLAQPEWRISDRPVDYPAAVAEMEARVAAIAGGTAPELIWLLEHPPIYTAGTSADPRDLLQADRFPVHSTGRGGQYTYHGPGQRVVYALLDLGARGRDLRAYVHGLETWVIETLHQFAIDGERRAGRVGIWVRRSDLNLPQREDKIAAVGVRVRRWVAYHGISINLAPDLTHFAGIVPCGIAEYGVTSLHDLGQLVTMEELDLALRAGFETVFGAGSPLARRD